MSKKIDLEKPLSDADRDYMLARDRHVEVAFNAVVHNVELPKKVRESMTARGITEKGVQRAAAAAGRLPEGAMVEEDDSAGSDDDSPEDGGPAKYSEEWFDKATIAELQPLLRDRGLPVTGKRGELADRLYDDMADKNELPEEDEGSGS